MTAGRRLVPAVGGTRQVPEPDPVAAEYILLGLRLDQHVPGVVDGYYGPADLKAGVDMEQARSPARLREDIAALFERVERDVEAPDRRDWLTAQLIALDAQVGALDGVDRPYADLVERYMGFAPARIDDRAFERAATEIDTLLPGEGTLPDRLRDWDRGLEIPVASLPAVIDWLVTAFRERAARDLGLPPGEAVAVGLVKDQPWGGYNWYDGGRRSRVDINTDLPIHASSLPLTIAHETYPGHHLEQAWKEADLVDEDGRLEASILLINTPESPVSEGLADYGTSLASPIDERADLLVELFDRAGMAMAADPVAARDVAERAVALAGPRKVLGSIRGNAAFLRHADVASHDDVLAYLRDVGRFTDEVAVKRLEFIEHPLWRTYVFAYEAGEALVARWVGTTEAPDRVGRFGRLLHEQVTPGRLLASPG